MLVVGREELPGFDRSAFFGEAALKVSYVILLILLTSHVTDLNSISVAKGYALKSLHPWKTVETGRCWIAVDRNYGLCSE